ncbi:MAG: J domain-containing protein [Acidimicrobiales bacterium]
MDQTSSDPAFRPAPSRSFPGGNVRLPKLKAEDRAEQPRIDVVGTAFIGGGTATLVDEPEPSGFTGYFTYESLFEEPEPVNGEGDDPYDVLKVSRDDDWQTIVSAHRSLVKEFHPDRFVDHPADVVAAAEDEIKRINLAYSELRKIHAADERRSGADRRA